MDVKKSNPIKIGDKVYWVGALFEKRLEINIYLRIYEGNDKKVFMLIDPGPPSAFDILRENLNELNINPTKIQFIYLNHQDPDVSTNSMYFLKYNPKIKVICTEDTWRLVSFLGFSSKNFQDIDRFKSKRAQLSTGHTIRFIPTPFCHFRGASMLYDEESRILFSGDLLGGITQTSDLFANEENWHGIRAFHQLYMPSQNALRNALDQIRKLKPKPLLIAPQHGALIQGDLIDTFIDKLYDLPVGWEVLETLVNNRDFYIEALNDIIYDIRRRAGADLITMAFKKIETDGSFPTLFELKDGQIIDIKLDPTKSLKLLLDVMMEDQTQEIREIIRNAVLRAAVDWNLPLFENLIHTNNGEKSELFETNVN